MPDSAPWPPLVEKSVRLMTGPSVAIQAEEMLLSVRDLSVDFVIGGVRQPAVRGANLDLKRGEVLAIVGESGSGKSVTAMSIMGLLPENAALSGTISLEGRDLKDLDLGQRRAFLAKDVAMIFQDPEAALNPVFSIGFQLRESVRKANVSISRSAARARAIELLTLVEIAEPERRMKQYPHQLSGGQCQRVMIAMALAGEPKLLIADEPTTALDVTVQADVLDLLRRMRDKLDNAILLITHDMGVVADLADRVAVMCAGQIVEVGDVRQIFSSPEAPYTRQLLAAVPTLSMSEPLPGERAATVEPAPPVLDVRGVSVDYGTKLKGLSRAVDGVSLAIGPGEILALVGESGSGKTTIGRAVIGLAELAEGEISIGGITLGGARASRSQIRDMRTQVGVVFQNPHTSLNPRYTVGQSVAEPMRVHQKLRGKELAARVTALLESVGLGDGWSSRYPHELSGGQRQRVVIARAVSLEPRLLVADEPTSALDVSVQATVLDVMRELQQRIGFSCLFISHDLAVVESLCDSVAVMKDGKLVEYGSRSQVFGAPQHDYTKRLLAASPVADPDLQRSRRQGRVHEVTS